MANIFKIDVFYIVQLQIIYLLKLYSVKSTDARSLGNSWSCISWHSIFSTYFDTRSY